MTDQPVSQLYHGAFVQPLFDLATDEARSAARRLMEIPELSMELFANKTDLIFVMLQVMATQEVASILTHDFREYYLQFKDILASVFGDLGDPHPTATASI